MIYYTIRSITPTFGAWKKKNRQIFYNTLSEFSIFLIARKSTILITYFFLATMLSEKHIAQFIFYDLFASHIFLSWMQVQILFLSFVAIILSPITAQS